MDAKGKKRIVIWVSVAALLGVGGYVAYKVIKNKRDQKKAEEDASKTNTPASTPSGNSATKPDDSSEFNSTLATAFKDKKLAFRYKGKIYVTKTGRALSNPFKDEAQTLAFQKYVYNNLNDKSIGTPDGKWGLNTATAVLKYGTALYNTIL